MTIPARSWSNVPDPDSDEPVITLAVDATEPGDGEVRLSIEGTTLVVEATDPSEGMVTLSVIDDPAIKTMSVVLTPEQYAELINDGIRRLVLIRGPRTAVEAAACARCGGAIAADDPYVAITIQWKRPRIRRWQVVNALDPEVAALVHEGCVHEGCGVDLAEIVRNAVTVV